MLTQSQVHIHNTRVEVECGTVKAAVELAERLICAQPVAYIRLDSMRRLIADPTQVTQAVGRSIAAEDMIGLHPMPQASARRQALEEAIAAVLHEALGDPTDSEDDKAYNLAIEHCSKAIRKLVGAPSEQQPSTRKQALMEVFNMCRLASLQSGETGNGELNTVEMAVAFGAARQAEKLAEAIQKMINS
jgi:hypothetical protein